VHSKKSFDSTKLHKTSSGEKMKKIANLPKKVAEMGNAL
jgi:hypothetical protein